jgi:diacylglycerol kinase family enzyme
MRITYVLKGKGKGHTTFQTIIHPIITAYFKDRIHRILATEKAGGGYDRAQELIREECDLIVSCGGNLLCFV